MTEAPREDRPYRQFNLPLDRKLVAEVECESIKENRSKRDIVEAALRHYIGAGCSAVGGCSRCPSMSAPTIRGGRGQVGGSRRLPEGRGRGAGPGRVQSDLGRRGAAPVLGGGAQAESEARGARRPTTDRWTLRTICRGSDASAKAPNCSRSRSSKASSTRTRATSPAMTSWSRTASTTLLQALRDGAVVTGAEREWWRPAQR